MAGQPDQIVLKRDRDLDGRLWHPNVRRAILGLILVLVCFALANVFGQVPLTSRAATPAAIVSVYSPSHVRGGLLYTSRFHVTALTDLRKAQLVLSPGWFEGMQVNSMVPQPVLSGSHDGSAVLDLGHIAKGDSYILWIQFQVNPTNVGRRSQNVELADGAHVLMHIHRTITVFP
ncbi:MAG TPA: hypothetical protein VIG35_01455 [Gaiellaceae bacterium]|jgi:hypothetical protein